MNLIEHLAVLSLNTQWSDFFTTTPKIYCSNPSNWNGDYYVLNVIFTSLSNRALLMAFSSNTKVLIEYCDFTNVSATGNGGAINFGSYGMFVGNHNCADSCYCTGFCHFSLSIVSASQSAYNLNFYTSCKNCGQYNLGNGTIGSIGGYCWLNNSNISDCQAITRAAYLLEDASRISYEAYCHISNNNSSYAFVMKHYVGKTGYLLYMNFLNNNVDDYIFCSEGSYIILQNCSVIDNPCTSTFYNFQGEFVVTFSYFSNSGTIGSFVRTSSILSSSYVNDLGDINEDLCITVLPTSICTPIPSTPLQTPKSTPLVTMQATNSITPVVTPFNTPYETLASTAIKTPYYTPLASTASTCQPTMSPSSSSTYDRTNIMKYLNNRNPVFFIMLTYF
ncbi:hypothetical protein TVAG_372700 [Trichomonas vaginalis G3]|uniref:Uncharacterized protein n=1 Tax=Trichomonas vaginalis (strain ATCC PRA-98 / G3) TaxID=412133 RepID=A2EZ13_TRIV3|nr:hypothetical protein TVAGG3_0372990 [Trichomonas vaginalis G3]EAY02125.1 hypothetical protein TVAG_372700 [Trichomonas vaginalis G3]KAI5532730.1 hypothetical protein TVAGG3_0372990 [Trichomonas vaginalis G3]|eukprot:XP_001330545.1 hypothetical protein [Trichomonas vaginalis G3]